MNKELRDRQIAIVKGILNQCPFTIHMPALLDITIEQIVDSLALIDEPAALILSDEEKDMAWKVACGDNTDLVKLCYPDVLLQAQVKKCHKYYTGSD